MDQRSLLTHVIDKMEHELGEIRLRHAEEVRTLERALVKLRVQRDILEKRPAVAEAAPKR